MNSSTRTTRLGVLVAGSAALFAFGMSGPAQAAQPASGTVGHVPSKVPGGQTDDGSQDGNKGWQCDGNNGVGNGNPAHADNCPQGTGGDTTEYVTG